jgi:hypothetical protein
MAQAGLGDLSDLKSCYARGPNRGVNRPDLELKKNARRGVRHKNITDGQVRKQAEGKSGRVDACVRELSREESRA